ncbi:heterokaryon incompatibility protein-domain-containing protein [Paraphoma chrysanthemicola]|uniref:Heterokaryon incompatibility protein-domain-containing protein n=1 Tax=Paraphoma chrysanthemicola TaxID=798071 RepID=A0A8K0VXU0_9PLEO|nr:heterokaryon incompatibility protein-domain-containing protein [Paraphoma chrysanthemicola]
MAGDNRKFDYKSLRAEFDEVRLLLLHPATSAIEPLRCDLDVASLRENPKYEALSYVWGTPGNRGSMLLSGHVFTLYENLEAALRRLRRTNKSRALWIDAICINQNDSHEKTFQIPLMRRVYEQAEQVCIWLGEETSTSLIGMQALRGDALTMKKYWSSWRLNRKYGYLVPSYREQFSNLIHAEVSQEMEVELFAGEVRELLSRPWWNRVWTMQEAIVAKKVIFMCGAETASWANVESYSREARLTHARGMRVFGITLSSDHMIMDDDYALLSQLRQRWQDETWNFGVYELLYKFRRLGCTDPKDRVYGFLGLAERSLGFSINPEYELPVDQVYINVARTFVEKTKTLDILNCRREWEGDNRGEPQTRAYSLFDQARYHDVRCPVHDVSGKKPRLAWVRLPHGWERLNREGKPLFYNWTTRVTQERSPLEDCGPQPFAELVSRQKILSSGWQKWWNNLGVPIVKYCATDSHENKPPKDALEGRFLDLPSWTPNWSAYTDHEPDLLLNWSDKNRSYCAGGIMDRPLLPSPDARKLCLEGYSFDTIATLCNPWHPTSPIPPVSRKGLTVLQTWEEIAARPVTNCPYGGPEGRTNAIWRTHMADYAGDGAASNEDEPFIQCWYDRVGWARDVPDAEDFRGKGMWESFKLTTSTVIMESAMDFHLTDISPFIQRSLFKGLLSTPKKYGDFAKRIHKVCAHRALFVTQKGYIGLAPWNARVGDAVYVLKGGKTPFILRRKSVGEEFSLVGECYVYGIMGGEALSMGLPVEEVRIQ